MNNEIRRFDLRGASLRTPTDGYIPTSEPDPDEDIMAKAVLVAQRTIERKNQQLQAKDARIKVLEPKARLADAVAASDGTCLVGEFGSGCVMDKTTRGTLCSAFDDLRNGLFTAAQPRTSVDLIDSAFARSAIGGSGLERLKEAADRAAVLGQMEAVCRFLLEILYPAGIGEGVDDLLASESDEMDGFREFPNLRILRGLLDPRGDAGAVGDVFSRLFECLSLCEHDSSPNRSARTSQMRDDTDLRRGPGGSPNAARQHTRQGGA